MAFERTIPEMTADILRVLELKNPRLKKVLMEEYYRRLALISSLKDKNAKREEKMSEIKRAKLIKKADNDLKRYYAEFDRQTEKIENEQLFIDKCLKNVPPKPPSIIIEKNVEDSTIKREASDHCKYVQNNKTEESLESVIDKGGSYRRKFLARIEKVKSNFKSCALGVKFWENTEPMWNRMTQCLENPSDVENKCLAHEMMGSFTEDNLLLRIVMQEPYQRVDFDLQHEDIDDVRNESFVGVVQKTRGNRSVFESFTDEVVINSIKMAKSMLDPGATTAEIMKLTNRIIEHELDQSGNVNYVVNGLLERSVFEFCKKNIATRIFIAARKYVDRLGHINSGMIPRELIKQKRKESIAKIIYEIITDDKKYKRYDQPVDDEQHYVALMTETAADRMQASEVSTIPMTRRLKMFESIDEWVTMFLRHAREKIAHLVCTTNFGPLAQFQSNIETPKKITVMSIIRISRKITKLLFGRFRDENHKQNFDATLDAFKSMVMKRSPRVFYNIRVYKKSQRLDFDHFQRCLNKQILKMRVTV